MIKKKFRSGKKKKTQRTDVLFMAFFVFVDSKKTNKTPFFLLSKKCHFENTENKKNKNNLFNQTSF